MIDHFASYLQNPERFAYRPALRHGDFGGSSILYDPETYVVSGVIDFESIGFGDPAADVAALSTYGETYGEEFFPIAWPYTPKCELCSTVRSFTAAHSPCKNRSMDCATAIKSPSRTVLLNIGSE